MKFYKKRKYCHVNFALFLWLSLLGGAATNAHAQCPENSAEKVKTIGVVTGSSSGTYKKIGENIRDLLASTTGVNQVDLCIKESAGTVANVKRMASKENAGIGIVQSDVIEYLKNNPVPGVYKDVRELRLLAPLYNEEIHIFANVNIKTIKDLAGKRVSVGPRQGGSWLTATNLFTASGFSDLEYPSLAFMDASEAVRAVVQGDLDAMVYVAGKPVKVFEDLSKAFSLNRLKNVHFVNLTFDDFKNAQTLPYFSADINNADYSWLTGTTETLAVKALLVNYDFSRSKNSYFDKRCAQFSIVGNVLRDKINELQTGANWHKKWQQVQLDEPVPGWERDACSWNSLSIVTGSSSGTYIKFGNEIADVSRGKVFLEVKTSNGSVENIERMNSLENASIGIVQSDVILSFKYGTDPAHREIAEQLRLITPLYNEEVHLLARKGINSFTELHGKRVSAGRDGSGTNLTARLLAKFLNIEPKFVHQNESSAFQDLKNGEVDALMFVGGKPISFFQKLSARFKNYPQDFANIHAIPVPLSQLPSGLPYVNSELSPEDYSWLPNVVPTVAIKSLLVSNDFSSQKDLYTKRRCRQVHDVYESIKSNITSLQKGGHDKWNQVNLGGDIGGWKLDKCAHEIKFNSPTPGPRPNVKKCDKYQTEDYKHQHPGEWRVHYNFCLANAG